MSVDASGEGAKAFINRWARILGVSVRPWSGHAPLGMLVRGGIQVAVSLFFLVVLPRMLATDASLTGSEFRFLRGWVVLAVIALIGVLIVGAAQLVIGILDFVPRRQVLGAVMSMRERSTLDFLPYSVRRRIFERSTSNSASRLRQYRYEVVLQTPEGEQQQWTVRNARTRRQLNVGQRVRLSVTPITGHVAKVEHISR